MEIPLKIKELIKKLKVKKYEAYLVGGCVRDLLLEQKPVDWDITTNATPEEIQKIFPDSIYENKFGTVAVKTDSDDQTLKIVEITTFRKEGKYTDKRHPDEIKFAKTIEEDLARRDFTINALALDIKTKNIQVIDLFNGQEDLKNKIIRAVGNPEERFSEDALRLMRAVRLLTQLDSPIGGGWQIEKKTTQAIQEKAGLIEFIAKERVNEELTKIIMTENAAKGIEKMEELKLLNILPELRQGIGVKQNKHHIFTVFEHSIRSLDYAAKNNFSLEVRLAALLHDIGKPQAKEGEGPECTFRGHQIISAKMALKILDRFHFPKKITEKIALLIREHMFVYDPETVSLAGVRRLLRRVGPENIEDLLKLREADRIGSGVPKAQPYRLRHLKAMIEKVKQDPISVKMLKINGEDVMRELKIESGPKVGKILAVLLEEILDNPKLNVRQKLSTHIKKLNKLTNRELNERAEKAKQKTEEVQTRIDEEILKKYL